MATLFDFRMAEKIIYFSQIIKTRSNYFHKCLTLNGNRTFSNYNYKFPIDRLSTILALLFTVSINLSDLIFCGPNIVRWNIRRCFKWECTPGLNQPYKACRSGFKIFWELLGSLLNVHSRKAPSDLAKGLKICLTLRSHTLPHCRGFGQKLYLIKSCQITMKNSKI